jgi:outer membrane protein
MNSRLHLLIASALLAGTVAPAQAHEAGDWIFRAGVGGVEPKSDNLVVTDGVDTLKVQVDSAMSMTLSGTYMFTRNWGFDILAAYPFNHDINLEVVGLPGSVKIADTDQLPPTFSIQYHFMPDADFQPYAGLGVNYTTFFNTSTNSDFATEVGELDLDSSFGVAAQIGVDWMLGKNWLLNADLRWINIETDAKVAGEKIGTVEIDPWVYSINVGYRF